MHTFTQDTFAPPENAPQLLDEPLVVHRRSDKRKHRELIVLLHGLGGARYGSGSTWGNLPRFLFEDFPQCELGLYSYRTLLRRLPFWSSIELEQEAEVLGDAIRNYEQFRRVYLVGHSMGGMLAMGAVAYLLRIQAHEAVERIKGLLLLATPQLGSVRVPWIAQLFSADFRALRVHGRYVLETTRAFANSVHLAEEPPVEERAHLPTWALMADADRWVDRVSASAFLPSAQTSTVRKSHRTICKPVDQSDPGYEYLCTCLRKAQTIGPLSVRTTDECRLATESDVQEAFELASRYFDSDPSTMARIREWLRADARVLWIVRRRTPGPYAGSSRLVGYYCVLPLRADAVQRMRSGALTAATLDSGDLAPSREEPAAFYIGAVAAADRVAAGTALGALQQFLRDSTPRRGLLVLTRPITEDGLRLVSHAGMQPVNGGGGIGELYEMQMSR